MVKFFCIPSWVKSLIALRYWFYLGICVIILLIIVSKLIKFRNNVVNKKENIGKAKSRVRISKAKYLQVLRKVGSTQKDSNDAQGGAYATANQAGVGYLIGGAIGSVDSNFEEVGDLVMSLANEYQEAQQSLNELVNNYNTYISTFPRVVLAKIFRFKKEEYVDSENLEASTKLVGFDEQDI